MSESNTFIPADAELVERVRAGDTEAFDEIDRRYRNVLHRFLTRYVFGPELAEELVQRTLIRAFEMIGQLQSGDKLVGWLHRIAFRMAAAESRRRTTISLDVFETNSTRTAELVVVEVEETGETEEKQGIWQIAQRELSIEEFSVLSLRYREELSLAQIAKILNKNEGAVRVQLHRARKKLLPFFEKRES